MIWLLLRSLREYFIFSCSLISKNLLVLLKPNPGWSYWVLGSDCLYTCVLDALWVSQRETVRALTDAKFRSLQVESHKLQSVQRWSGSVLISIPIHCGFIAYLFLAHGKHFPNNIYSSRALARWVFLLCPSCKRCVWVRCDTDDGLVTSQDRSSHGLLTKGRKFPRPPGEYPVRRLEPTEWQAINQDFTTRTFNKSEKKKNNN